MTAAISFAIYPQAAGARSAPETTGFSLPSYRGEAIVPGELHGEITGEAVGALDDDGADAVARDAVKHVLEARALGHRVAALRRGPRTSARCLSP
jgi:hypothetical protein